MNGQVETYRLDEPMKWFEFRGMPVSLQKQYITELRQKFGVPDVKLAEMLGVNNCHLGVVFKQIGLAKGRGGYQKKWDVVGWRAWLNGNRATALEEDVAKLVTETKNTVSIWEATKERVVFVSGSMTFEGCADNALNALRQLLGGATVKMTVEWTTHAHASEGGAADV